MAVAPDLDVEFLAERVDAAHAHAVQAARHLVGGGIEFAAGMELGQNHLDRRHPLPVARVHHVHGNAAAVVDHGDRVVDVDDDVNFLGIAGQGFVHRVVDHLVDQVVQSHLARGADVHGRTKANRLKSFQNFDIFAGVAVVVSGHGENARCFSRHRIPFGLASSSA